MLVSFEGPRGEHALITHDELAGLLVLKGGHAQQPIFPNDDPFRLKKELPLTAPLYPGALQRRC